MYGILKKLMQFSAGVRLGKLPMVLRTWFVGAAISTDGYLPHIPRREKHKSLSFSYQRLHLDILHYLQMGYSGHPT
jgi:hypothetical protein